jgi:1-deoxy-D-xylulose-5-phosphate reductoisomerase
VLGSTGSIGTSTLNVLARHPERFRVVALTAYGKRDLLDLQARAYAPDYVGLVSEKCEGWATGPECLVEAATHPDVDIVVNGIVGAAGLEATIAALRAGKRVALANKEALVMAGELARCAAREGGGEIIPVDSEHSAVFQCLGGRASSFARIILTASGGPFHTWSAAKVRRATIDQALNHPTWSMGRKITVDSATLVNKALEVIEAHFLFGAGYDQVTAVVHPQSIIHSFVEFTDGSVLAQLGFPNMELPILYALSHPERLVDDGTVRFDPLVAGALTFEPIRNEVFPAFGIGIEAGKAGGTAPTVFNAANEEAVAAFLAARIPFGRIPQVIETTLEHHDGHQAADSLGAVRDADDWARRRAMEILAA